MRRSSKAITIFVLSFVCALPLVDRAQAMQGSQQLPIQDLTPPSDVEAARLEAEAAAAAEAAAKAQTPVSSSGAPAGQVTGGKTDGSYLIRKEVEEVILYATVVDPRNRLVNNLARDSFQVYEDGQAQKITSFRREDIPVSLGILIDNSGSMRDKRPAVNNAAVNFVRASNKEDEIFMVNFADEPYLDQDFTNDVSLLREALEKVDSRGGTAVYDAVVAASDHLTKGGKRDKKVLLVVTDGEDNSSRDTLEEAVRRVQDGEGPTVYTIGILGDDRNKKRARRALERLAIETGGVAYFPKDLSEVDAITRAVAHDIRNQYTIGYKPTRPQSEGGFRNVKVEAVTEGKRLQVRTRSGYYAGQKTEAKKR